METMSARITFLLDEIKADRDLNRQQVADAIGISNSAISKWESGATKDIKNAHLFAFADRFGYSARWIVTGDGPRRAAEVREQMCRDYVVDKLTAGELIDVSGLPDEARSALEATVDAFVGAGIKKKQLDQRVAVTNLQG